MKISRRIAGYLLALVCAGAAMSHAATIHVPADQPTIQAGIDAAVDGDTVLVAPGSYGESISFLGKRIAVMSVSGPNSTTISGLGTTIVFIGTEDRSAILSGFTITGGTQAINLLGGCSPTVENNRILNYSSGSGTGVVRVSGAQSDTPPLFKRNVFVNPSAWAVFYCIDQPVEFINNTVAGGIRGLIIYSSGSIVNNNIITGCTYYGFYNSGSSYVRTYNNVWNNAENYLPSMLPDPTDISSDPFFTDEGSLNFSLLPISPCIDAGNPNPEYNDPDGSRNDIGAHSFVVCEPSAIYVPTDFSSIQDAVDSACINDTIFIQSGDFNESVTILGKQLTIIGAGSSETRIISPLYVTSATVAIAGITITGSGIPSGGLNIETSSVQLTNVVFEGCSGCSGGAVYAASSRLSATNCVFNNNITDQCTGGGDGAAISCINGTLRMIGCVVTNNRTQNEFGVSFAGIVATGDTCIIISSLFEGNSSNQDSRYGGPGNACLYTNGIYNEVTHCTFTNNVRQGESDLPLLIEGGIIRLKGVLNVFDSNLVFSNAVSYTPHSSEGGVLSANESGPFIQIEGNRNYAIGNQITNNTFSCTLHRNLDYFGTEAHAVLNGIGIWLLGFTTLSDNIIGDNSTLLTVNSTDTCSECSLTVISDGSGAFVSGNVDEISRNIMAKNSINIVAPRFEIDTTVDFGEVYCSGSGLAECNIIFEVYDYNPFVGQYLDIQNNYYSDPWFCHSNYDVYDFSVALAQNNQCSFNIGSVNEGCLGTPEVLNIHIDGTIQNANVLATYPLLQWTVFDPSDSTYIPDSAFQLAVGADNDWAFAEMWNPAPFNSPDTFITYAGAPLSDGATYYLRLRVHNSLVWSDWYEASFRMNSVPGAPALASPGNNGVVTSMTPTLYAHNASDAESDPLTYIFEVYSDAGLATLIEDDSSVTEQTDSTGWAPVTPLADDQQYWWRTKATDGFEYSNWSSVRSFYVNSTNSSPTAFVLHTPDDSARVFDMLPQFYWGESFDVDPFDSVRFTLKVSLNPSFTFLSTADSIYDTTYHWADSLEFADEYWWRVEARDVTGALTMSPTYYFPTWVLGDSNGDGATNIGDVTFLIARIFGGGPSPMPNKVGDVNGDCAVNIADVTYLIARIFAGGPAPKVGCAP